MDFNLHVELGNAAMNTREDVAEALERVAGQLRSGSGAGAIIDANGNTTGNYSFEGITEEFRIMEQAVTLGHNPSALDEALEAIWGHGMADDEAGGVDEPGGQTFRVSRFTVHTDSDGSKTTTEHDTEADAEEHMDGLHDAEVEEA